MNLLITADGYSVSFITPILLFGWVPFTVFLFFIIPPRKALLFSIVAGFLFLPMARYDVIGLGYFDKKSSIGLGILIGSILSGMVEKKPFRLNWIDLPMIVWVFFSPLATSLSNGLGIYDGISGGIQNYFHWGVYYWSGRRYFFEKGFLRDLIWFVLAGGFIYVFLIMYEVRMSPQLSNIVYGFFPHSWVQHWRYGGYRPIVFMQHGLMVALWMAITTTIAYWLWRTGEIVHVKGIPMVLIVFTMIFTTIICKSANGWVFLLLGILSFSIGKQGNLRKFLTFLILIPPVYIILRISSIISIDLIQNIANIFFDDSRVVSLLVRLRQEMLFGTKAIQRPLLGWGGYNRGWPVDMYTGQRLVTAVDSLWVITFSSNGLVGLFGVFGSLGIGAWKVLRKKSNHFHKINTLSAESTYILILCIVVIFFMLDSLLNAMVNPVYILISGVLASVAVQDKNEAFFVKIAELTEKVAKKKGSNV